MRNEGTPKRSGVPSSYWSVLKGGLLHLPVLGVQPFHPHGLPGCELVHAAVVRVIHEIMDRVKTGELLARTRVAAFRTPTGRGALARRVAHVIVVGGAAVLEGVVQAEPVC